MLRLQLRKVGSVFYSLSLPLALFGLCAALGSEPRSQGSGPGEIARGKYLVEEVAKCGECHSPRDAAGNLNTHAWLTGAPIWITPVRPIQNWADTVPPLAGLPGLNDVQIGNVLERGIGPEGEALRPPMHIYHMTHSDAMAIAAYLKSLPRENH